MGEVMARHFEPDRTDTRYRDDIDKRCVNCGHSGMDHYNGQCPKPDPEPDNPEWTVDRNPWQGR